MEKYEFVSVQSCDNPTGSAAPLPNNKTEHGNNNNKNRPFTGLIVYRRNDGTRICEREFLNGYAWGCCRYFNRNDRFVGQDWYGRPGYDLDNPSYVCGGVALQMACVDFGECRRISQDYTRNHQSYHHSRNAFEGSVAFRYTGLDICTRNRRPQDSSNDVSLIAEREWMNGTAWGCCRYYNEQGKFVGQVYYGDEGTMGEQQSPVKLDDTPGSWPRTPFKSSYMDKSEYLSSKNEFYASRAAIFLERISGMVETKEDFARIFCKINDDEFLTRIAQSCQFGEIPEDLNQVCNLRFHLMQEFVSHWLLDDRFAQEIDKLISPPKTDYSLAVGTASKKRASYKPEHKRVSRSRKRQVLERSSRDKLQNCMVRLSI